MTAGSASIHGAYGHEVHDASVFAQRFADFIKSGVLNGSFQPPHFPPTVPGFSGDNRRDTIYALGSKAHAIVALSDLDHAAVHATVVGARGNQTLFGGTGSRIKFLGGTATASLPGAISSMAAGTNQTLTGGSSSKSAPFKLTQHDIGTDNPISSFASIVPATSLSSQDIASSLRHQTVGPGGVSIIMPDETKFTFADLTKPRH